MDRRSFIKSTVAALSARRRPLTAGRGVSSLFAVLLAFVPAAVAQTPAQPTGSAAEQYTVTPTDLGRFGLDGDAVARFVTDAGEVFSYAWVDLSAHDMAVFYSLNGVSERLAPDSPNVSLITVNVHGQALFRTWTEYFTWSKSVGYLALPLGGFTSVGARDLNAAGDIVGYGQLALDNSSHAVVWRDGQILDLGTFGGRATAIAVSDGGDVLVGADDADRRYGRFFLWRDGTATELTGCDTCQFRDVNSSGLVIGHRIVPHTDSPDPAEYHAVAWTADEGVFDLGVPGTWNWADRINEAGLIVACQYGYIQGDPCYLWQNGSLTPLGNFWARAINGRGDLAGFVEADNSALPAARFADGTVVPLDTRWGDVAGLNERGDFVGFANVPPDFPVHAMSWHIERNGDTMPPVISGATDLTVDATSPQGAAVWFDVDATDTVDPAPTITCTPPSGALFPIGSTGVTCTASDAAGNTATALFTVTVRGAEEQLDSLPDLVASLNLKRGIENSLDAKLSAALAAVDGARTGAACSKLGAFINEVEAQSGKAITADDAAILIAVAGRIRAVLGCM